MEFTNKEEIYDVIGQLYLIIKDKLNLSNNQRYFLKDAKEGRQYSGIEEEINLYETMIRQVDRELLDIDNVLICLNLPIKISYKKKKNGYYLQFTIRYKGEIIGSWRNNYNNPNDRIWLQVDGLQVAGNWKYINVKPRVEPLKNPYKDEIILNIED